jgi:tetratricopeptide (TPR) repeat protein
MGPAPLPVYNKSIAQKSPKITGELLLLLLAPILIVLAGLAVWSNHFESTFQDDDFHVIVNNRALRDLGNIPKFFGRPLLYADKPEYVEYRPLAETSFAFDYWLASPINPGVYSIDSFAWFLLAVLTVGLLAGAIPGVNRWVAFFATAVFAFHPLAGEAVNYSSRRGDLMGTAALAAGLAFWIVWPRRLPKEIMHWEGVPKTEWDDFKRRWSPRLNAWYRSFINAPLHLYLIPIAIGLFADPGVAVFPLLLLAYIFLFDNGPKRRNPWMRVLPSAILCGGFAAAQLAITWKYAAGYRLPLSVYWISQPWVALRYLWSFVFPIRLVAVSDLHPLSLLSPLALVGIAGFAGLIALALRLGRRSEWRGVSFGLWWFLIALLPTQLIPQRQVEADYRVFMALPGLAIALGFAGLFLYRRMEAGGASRLRVNATWAAIAAAVVISCCAITFQRNKVWSSQEEFWSDVTSKEPGNGRAFAELGSVLIAAGQFDRGVADLKKAAGLIDRDAPDEIRLAHAFDMLNRDPEAEEEYKKAIADGPEYSSAWSAYSQWLIQHQKLPDALQAAQRAVKISPWNIEAQHTLLDYYSQTIDWEKLLQAAHTLLLHDPTDEDAHRSLSVAESAFEEVKAAERKAKQEPTVDDFLALSVQYYKTRRFEDSIKACQQALQIRPDTAEAFSNEAASFYALGRVDDAIHALREAIRLRPDFNVAKQNLAFLMASRPGTAPPGTPQ